MRTERELLTAEQVGRLLGIDRSTVYRMAEQGRLPAAKVGRQWRFRAEHVERMLAPAVTVGVVDRHDGNGDGALPPRYVVQPLIDSLAPLLGVMLVVTDMAGQPVTDVANPCGWFRERGIETDVIAACVAEWRDLADSHDLGPQWWTGPLGYDCSRAFIRSGASLVGMVLAGGVAASDDDDRDLHHLNPAQRARVLEALPLLAAHLSRITSDAHPNGSRSDA